MQHPDPYIAAMDRWGHGEATLLLPASVDEVVSVFAHLGQPLSRDVLRLYTICGGFVDYEMDGLWSLWSLSRVVSENQAARRQLIWFADYLIMSHVYAFRYVDSESSAVFIDWGTEPPQLLANSVERFLQLYADDPEDVCAWKL